MKIPNSIIQKIQEQLPDAIVEVEDTTLIVDGMRARGSWAADGCTSVMEPLGRADAEQVIVDMIVNAYHETAELRELMK